jgi:Na+/proline symporter
VLLSLGSLVAGDLLGRGRDDPRTTRAGKRIAAAVMVAVAALALAPRITLWRLIELKMELLIQCVPAFLLAIHWPRLGPGAALAGLVVGGAIAAGATLAGADRVGGVHIGVLALGVNVGLCVAATWLPERIRARDALGERA